MGDLGAAAAIVGAYVALLFGIAAWAERRCAAARSRPRRSCTRSRWACYATAWSYYGSVGLAARSGLLFLTVYLGPTLCAIGVVVGSPQAHPDQGGVRGDGHPRPPRAPLREVSPGCRALATALLVVGLVPYLALQLKTLSATLGLVAGGGG